MPARPTPPATPLDHREGRIVQSMRKDQHVSLALDLGPADVTALGLGHGDRLRISAGGHEAEVFYHGWMKAWSMYRRFFGADAHEALARDPGIDAYLESDRLLGGTDVPGQSQWLRIRLALAHAGPEPALFSLPEGTPVRLQVVARAPRPLPLPRTRVKDGTLQATVLASHPHALTLGLAFPALRKLGGDNEDWYTLELGGQTLAIHQRRGILPLEYEAYFARPEALLFEFVGHWADEETTVMLLVPMQVNWPGRYPDFASATLPLVVEPGTAALLRREGAAG